MKIKLFEKLDSTPISKATPEQISELKQKIKDVEDTSIPALKRTPISKATPGQIEHLKKVVSGKKLEEMSVSGIAPVDGTSQGPLIKDNNKFSFSEWSKLRNSKKIKK